MNMNGPLVSVILPIYNMESRISLFRQAVSSVFNQNYRPVELVVVDDCSSDSSFNLARTYLQSVQEELHDENQFKWQCIRTEQNGGPSVSRNTGIINSTGLFVSFLDWDDLYFPDFIPRCVELVTNKPETKVVLCPVYLYRVDKDGKESAYACGPPNDINDRDFTAFCAYLLENNFPTAMGSAVFCNKELFTKQNSFWFDEKLSKLTAEDIHFGFNLLAHEIRPVFLNETLAVHRGWWNNNSRSTEAALRMDELFVHDYIAEKACDKLIEMISQKSPDKAAALLLQKKRQRETFYLKKLVLQKRFLEALSFIASHPKLAKSGVDYFSQHVPILNSARNFYFNLRQKPLRDEGYLQSVLALIERSSNKPSN